MAKHWLRLSEEEEKEFQTFKGIHKIKKDSEGLRRLVKDGLKFQELKERPKEEDKEKIVGHEETDYYYDCDFATYLKEKRKMHCACHWKDMKWLPKDRLVDPEPCKTCYERHERFKERMKKEKGEKRQVRKFRPLRDGSFGSSVFDLEERGVL